MHTKPHPDIYVYMYIYVYVYRMSEKQMHCAESYSHTLYTHHIHALQVAQVCVGRQKFGCILPQCIALIFSHPRYSHALQVTQVFVGRQKIECILQNRIYRLTP